MENTISKFIRQLSNIINFLLSSILLPVAVSVTTTIVTTKAVPPTEPEIKIFPTYNSPEPTKYRGKFKILKPTVSSCPTLEVSIRNIGKKEANNIRCKVSFMNGLELVNVVHEYNPSLLESLKSKSNQEKQFFLEHIDSLPVDSSINYSFSLNRFIKTNNEFKIEVVSQLKYWPLKATIDYLIAFFIPQNAYALDSICNKSGNFSGYDTILFSRNILNLLLKKCLLDKTYKEKLSFELENIESEDAITDDILYFSNLLIDGLIENKILSSSKGDEIIENSKNNEGVLYNSINILSLYLGVLDALLDQKYITDKEGQNVIDNSVVRLKHPDKGTIEPPRNLRIIY